MTTLPDDVRRWPLHRRVLEPEGVTDIATAFFDARRAMAAPREHVVGLSVQSTGRRFGRRDLGVLALVIAELRREDRLGRLAWPALHAGPLAHLTERQREVARRMLQGRSAKQIARTLGLSTHTVYGYSKAMYRKLGVSGRMELVALLHGRSPAPGEGPTGPETGDARGRGV